MILPDKLHQIFPLWIFRPFFDRGAAHYFVVQYNQFQNPNNTSSIKIRNFSYKMRNEPKSKKKES